LLRHIEGAIDLHADVPDRTLQLSLPEKQLACAQIAAKN
jgi:hypothetical protein